ncbi:hypothetical protein CC86DRAFT_314049, partial [Ophiobolus disseminans]
MQGLQQQLRPRHKNNRKKMLQTPKNLYNYLKEAREELHNKKSQKIGLRSVVLMCRAVRM